MTRPMPSLPPPSQQTHFEGSAAFYVQVRVLNITGECKSPSSLGCDPFNAANISLTNQKKNFINKRMLQSICNVKWLTPLHKHEQYLKVNDITHHQT